ncbi:MAG TPA: hypothetical protein VGS20_01650 [Candidatus Acidoferrales bacterium]|nr:hypothetical protein [Candidatus Acidoferrales bacterium]
MWIVERATELATRQPRLAVVFAQAGRELIQFFKYPRRPGGIPSEALEAFFQFLCAGDAGGHSLQQLWMFWSNPTFHPGTQRFRQRSHLLCFFVRDGASHLVARDIPLLEQAKRLAPAFTENIHRGFFL